MSERRVGLATEGVVADVPSIIAAETDELAAHTRLDIANAHGGLVTGRCDLYDRNVNYYDSKDTVIGKKVGTWGVEAKIGNAAWVFPAAISPTGPGKVPRLGAFSPSFQSYTTTGPGPAFYPIHFVPVVLGGDGPLLYHYDYLVQGNWISWPAIEQGGNPASIAFEEGGDQAGFLGMYSQNDGITTFGGGNDGTHTFVGRLTVTNLFGVAYRIWPGTAFCTFQYQFTHNPSGSWIIFQTSKLRPLTNLEIFRIHKLRAWANRHHPEETAFYTGREGKFLVDTMVKQGHDFNTTLPIVEVILSDASYEQRYTAFRDLVFECVARYWPACSDQVWLNHRYETLRRLGRVVKPAGYS